jgi:hypothetical protein
MASTLKVDRIESPAGINVGNISFGNAISGDGSQLTDLNIAGANMSWTNAVIPAGQLSGTITSGVDGSGLVNLPAVPPDLTATNVARCGPVQALVAVKSGGTAGKLTNPLPSTPEVIVPDNCPAGITALVQDIFAPAILRSVN